MPNVYYRDDETDYSAAGEGFLLMGLVALVLFTLLYGTILTLVIFSPFFFINTFTKTIINLFGFETYGWGLFRFNLYFRNARFSGYRHTFVMSFVHLFFSCFFLCVFIGSVRGVKELWFVLKETYPFLMEKYRVKYELTTLELFFKTVWNTCVFSFRYVKNEYLTEIMEPLVKLMSSYVFLSQKYLGKLLSYGILNFILHVLISTVLHYIACNILFLVVKPLYYIEEALIGFAQKHKKLFKGLLLGLLICPILYFGYCNLFAQNVV